MPGIALADHGKSERHEISARQVAVAFHASATMQRNHYRVFARKARAVWSEASSMFGGRNS